MISRLSAVLLALVASLALGSGVRGQCSGDVNGDGRVDVVAVGRQTHNVKIYWNETK